jgi:hypothetical protein
MDHAGLGLFPGKHTKISSEADAGTASALMPALNCGGRAAV